MNRTPVKNEMLAGLIVRSHNRQLHMGCTSPWLWISPCGSHTYRKPAPPAEGNRTVIGVPLHDREITPCRAMAFIEEYRARGGWTLGDAWALSSSVGELLGGNLAVLPRDVPVAWLSISPDRASFGAHRDRPEDMEAEGWRILPVRLREAVFVGDLVAGLNRAA